MKLYVGIDLHSNNNYVGIIDEAGKSVFNKRLPNDLMTVQNVLQNYQTNIGGVVVESTYNWYWLVDGLMALGYKLYLANPAGNEQYEGIKHTNDKTDALWLARLLQLNVLKSGYIYPKKERGVRDLLRKRSILMSHQTSCLLSIKSTITRHTGITLSARKIKEINGDQIKEYIQDESTILGLESQHRVLDCIMGEVNEIEQKVLKKVKAKKEFKNLTSIPGIGPILGLTILLETGEIKRFKTAGHYVSYCRCIGSQKLSNGKSKGKNNRKNGNKYLCWAFIEAANFAIRSQKEVQKYYQKKLAKTNNIVAIKTIAHKLAKASYFILRDGLKFDIEKMFRKI